MDREDDDRVDIELPFFGVHVRGGSRRVYFGSGADYEEDVIDMESGESGEYWAVRRRVRRRLRFIRHAVTFAGVNLFLFLLDWSTGGGFWVQWVALIWGAFLLWEFISIFVGPSLWGRDMERRWVERELRRRRGV
jgi:hypothetical protein